MRLRRRINSTVKVRVGESHTSVTKSNCVTVRWGGKQLAVNDQSVGNELDSAGCSGEHACGLRSLKIITYVVMARKTICGRIKWLEMEWSEVYAR